MRKLDFADVRAAGLPAHVEAAPLHYEYRPLFGDVAVYLEGTARPLSTTTHRVPARGWSHDPGCACRFCEEGEEVGGEQEGRDAVAVW